MQSRGTRSLLAFLEVVLAKPTPGPVGPIDGGSSGPMLHAVACIVAELLVPKRCRCLMVVPPSSGGRGHMMKRAFVCVSSVHAYKRVRRQAD